MFDKNSIPNYGKIRVSVNEHGEGTVKQSFASYQEVENAINNNEGAKVSGWMIEAGMASEDINEVIYLIEKCIVNNNPRIRNAGFTALWYIILRFEDKVPFLNLKNCIRIGLNDNDASVLELMQYIREDLQRIDYQKIDELFKN